MGGWVLTQGTAGERVHSAVKKGLTANVSAKQTKRAPGEQLVKGGWLPVLAKVRTIRLDSWPASPSVISPKTSPCQDTNQPRPVWRSASFELE